MEYKTSDGVHPTHHQNNNSVKQFAHHQTCVPACRINPSCTASAVQLPSRNMFREANTRKIFPMVSPSFVYRPRWEIEESGLRIESRDTYDMTAEQYLRISYDTKIDSRDTYDMTVEKHFRISYKGKVIYGQEPPSGESTTTEDGVTDQLLAIIYWITPMRNSYLQSTSTSYGQWRQRR